MELKVMLGIILTAATVINSEFVPIGTYHSKHLDDSHYYEKSFFIPRQVKTSWIGGKRYCEAHNYQLATFETLGELNSILRAKSEQPALFSRYTFIGGKTNELKSRQNWFWIYTKQKVAYKMVWEAGEPNGDHGNGYCLSFGPSRRALKFNDISCTYRHLYAFICMKIRKFKIVATEALEE